MDQTNKQTIERSIEIAAPVARVWRALTDHREFGTWFRARIDAPFAPGEVSRGQITYPGYEHMAWEAHVERMDPERYFAFRWPHTEEGTPSSGDTPMTLVEFHLEPTSAGTRLTVVESGFEVLPDPMRSKAIRENSRGWEEQMQNIQRHVGHGD